MQVGGKPDFADPVVLSADRGGTSIEALCQQIHKSLVADFSYALVWGTSSKHYPQRCQPSHVHLLQSRDKPRPEAPMRRSSAFVCCCGQPACPVIVIEVLPVCLAECLAAMFISRDDGICVTFKRD